MKALHTDNIRREWGPRKKLGPTFLIKESALAKARAFEKYCSLDFDVKGYESNVLPLSYNKGKFTYSDRSPYTTTPAGSSQPLKEKAPSKDGKNRKTNKNRISTGIIENIPVSVDMSDLTRNLSKATSNIKSLHMITTKKNKPTTTVKVTFNTWPAPLIIKGDQDYEVNPCKIPYLRCNNCQQHGHSTKECTAKIPACPMCGGIHTYADCDYKNKPDLYMCPNCLEKGHNAANPSCSAFKQHKKLIDAKNATIKAEWDSRRNSTKQQAKQVNTTFTVVDLTKKDNFPPLHPLPTNKHKHTNQPISVIVTMDNAEPPSHPVPSLPDSTQEQMVTKSDLKRILVEVLRSNISTKPLDEQVKIIDGIVENNFPDPRTEEATVTAKALPITKPAANVPRYTAAKPIKRPAVPITSTPKKGLAHLITKQRHLASALTGQTLQPTNLSNKFNALGSPITA